MAAIQGRVSKLMSSSRLLRLVYVPLFEPSSSHVSGASSSPLWLKAVRHFSYSHNKDGSINGSTGASEDFSLTEGESGFSDSGNNGNGNWEAYSIKQNPSKSIPGRPLRGDKSFGHSRPRFQEPNRGSHSFSPNFDGKKRNKYPKTEFEYRSLRGVGETNRDVEPSDNSFLERFKLGFDEQSTNPSETPAGNQSEEDGSNPDQPITETGPQDVDEIFKKMKENSLVPNAVALLDGLCKDGLVDEAMKLFGLI
ncbi:hypothetical protein L6164_008694 [Bauhinia variegata]|uniref:Uncharacterized protein n=1 Tax=Bauhinia variegata TaxID=167791 RepID=A0ACB9PHI9_BAUVA|nr:hypothetical protein L6164_008694 [Bauhinia variegata]